MEWTSLNDTYELWQNIHIIYSGQTLHLKIMQNFILWCVINVIRCFQHFNRNIHTVLFNILEWIWYLYRIKICAQYDAKHFFSSLSMQFRVLVPHCISTGKKWRDLYFFLLVYKLCDRPHNGDTVPFLCFFKWMWTNPKIYCYELAVATNKKNKSGIFVQLIFNAVAYVVGVMIGDWMLHLFCTYRISLCMCL